MRTWRLVTILFFVLCTVAERARGEVEAEEQNNLLPAGDGTLDAPIDFTNADDVMDKLGPVMMNADGSMSRIANWKDLTQRERRTYLKKLAKGKTVGSGPRLINKDKSEM